jgi:YfiH family protein
LTWRVDAANMDHMMGESFVRCSRDGLVIYACKALENVPGLYHGFSTRRAQGGCFNLTYGRGGSRETVDGNRASLLNALGLGSARLKTLAQVHSDRVEVFTNVAEDEAEEGDALATRESGIALAVQVADCFPVLIAHERSGCIAAVHSGWRGTASRILRKTIERMRAEFGVDPGALIVAIGPGIRDCCLQVGPEVASRFDLEYPGQALVRPQAGRGGKHLLDLPGALAIQCFEAGVPPERVFDIDLCTRCRTDEFFSYRGEGEFAGRMMAVIGRV